MTKKQKKTKNTTFCRTLQRQNGQQSWLSFVGQLSIVVVITMGIYI